MSLVVVGSMALDSVETPFGTADSALGGSATYFSVSASFFTEVSIVAVVGEDFPQEHLAFLESRDIDLSGVVRDTGETFRWKGRYGYDLNEAQTLETHLNVFQNFRPQLPAQQAAADVVFLANIDPELQLEVLKQTKPKLVACDTMNFWISSKKEAVLEVLRQVDIVIINEGEARQLAGEANLVKAARVILGAGAKRLIVKRGEYGVLMFTPESVFAAPAYPLEQVFDPTGAGDTFAGGFMGYLANTGEMTEESIRQAIVFGSVMASFNVEDFSLDRLRTVTHREIEERFRTFRGMTTFGDLAGGLVDTAR